MIRIVDRRSDSKNKSSVNRTRFLRRFQSQVRKAVNDAVDQNSIRDLDEGRKIAIPGREIAEPRFGHGPGGRREQVLPGNDRFASGDTMDRPKGGGGQGQGRQGASPDGQGLDDFVFTLSREEFLDVFFEDLALPNLLKRHLAQAKEFCNRRAGYSQTGVPANLNLVRTMRGAAGRRIALGAQRSTLRALEAELATLLETRGEFDPEVRRVRQELSRLRAKGLIPFIDSFDLRYNNRIRVALPSTQAVMFCLMDVSGSMDPDKKSIAKRFFTLLYLFLTRTYEHLEIVFVRHHTVAEEVDEDTFFHSRETGGTVVSSALKLMARIIDERYPTSLWNIYGAQASDGDNWGEDSPQCRKLLEERLLGLTQYFAYLEIAEDQPQNLWREYEKVQAGHPEDFAQRRIRKANEIYPVFHELFKKRV
jgi:uncharacterized sporulation protein YeaH/YhbH (DUF444 family)